MSRTLHGRIGHEPDGQHAVERDQVVAVELLLDHVAHQVLESPDLQQTAFEVRLVKSLYPDRQSVGLLQEVLRHQLVDRAGVHEVRDV